MQATVGSNPTLSASHGHAEVLDVNTLLPARLWFIMIGLDAVGFVLLLIGLSAGLMPLVAAGVALFVSSSVLAVFYRLRGVGSG
ncbi:MAG: hypothetical protein U0837_09815 [Dehalococcoidia bacterium]